MRDITLEDTIYIDFSTRAFATGIPTVLAGSPVLSVLEENNATPITAGVSVSVSRASVVGLNEATIVATAANGYENGKGYSVYVSTGTVDSVSVVGEIVGEFTIGAAAAAVDLANGTDGLTALKTGIDAIPTTAMRGTDSALLASSAPTNFGDMSISVTTGLVDITQTAADKVWSTAARILTASTNFNDLSAAEVNAEVDTALDTAISELGVAQPTATPTIRTGLMLLYMALRNKLDVQTSGTDALEIHNDAGTLITSKLLTDDGSDYSEAKMT